MRRLAQACGVIGPGFALGVAVLATGDALRLVPAAGRFIGSPLDALAAGVTLLAVYGLSAVLGLLAVAAVLALIGPADLAAWPGALRARLIDMLRGQQGEPRRGAQGLAALISIALFTAVGFKLTLYFVDNFNTPRLVAMATVAALLCLIGLAVVSWAALAAGLTLLARLPGLRHAVHARSALVVVALGTAALAVFAVVEERTLFKELDGWQLYLPAAALGAVALSVPMLPGGLVRALTPRLSAGWFALAGLLVATLVGGLSIAPLDVRARAWLATSGRSIAPLITFWSARFDRDGDGVAWLLGGGDCATGDPFVYPGAVDIPDNGIDEDCFDGDLQAPLPLQPAPPAAPVALTVARPDVILFSIDGCRRDALGVYGAGAGRTPNLDAFAAEAALFEDVVASSSWTMPSFVGMMTSRYPSELPGFYAAVRATRVAAGVPLLQTPFHRAGYRTVAITTGLQLDKLGLDRDLDEWRALSRDPKGSLGLAVAEAGAEMLRNSPADQPLFLWLHLIDLHHPYEPPAEHRRFGHDQRGMYTAELHYVDAAFASVQRAIDDSGRRPRSVVMVFADHGESFGEHGVEFHGHTTYAAETRVPWMVRAPGVAPRRIPDLVGLVDLAPTLWQLAGLQTREPTRGRSLAPLLVAGAALPSQPLLIEQTRYTRDFSLVTPHYQLRHDQTRNYLELFDRVADPAQLHNLADALPHVVTELRRQLNRQLAPIAYIAGQRLAQVLLRQVPEGYAPVRASFVDGPALQAVRVQTLSPRRLDVAVVFASNGALDGSKFEVELAVLDAEGRRLGAHRGEATDGVYLPVRWRPGDHVQHQAKLTLSQNLPAQARLCVGLLIDKVPRPAPEGATQVCVPLAPASAPASAPATQPSLPATAPAATPATPSLPAVTPLPAAASTTAGDREAGS